MLGGTISSSDLSICCAIRNGNADPGLEHAEPLLLASPPPSTPQPFISVSNSNFVLQSNPVISRAVSEWIQNSWVECIVYGIIQVAYCKCALRACWRLRPGSILNGLVLLHVHVIWKLFTTSSRHAVIICITLEMQWCSPTSVHGFLATDPGTLLDYTF